MGRLSRGCLRCRERRVGCDGGRPSCRRCINRGEICEGYRDESTLMFRHDTDKVTARWGGTTTSSSQASQSPPQTSFQPPLRRRSRSVDGRPSTSALTCEDIARIQLRNPRPWLKKMPDLHTPLVEEQMVDQFMEQYVMYPCNQTSSPGFLEHLPCMFKEVNVEGRYALRWAVQAAAYGGASKEQWNDAISFKALNFYGKALKALGESLSSAGKTPDDYDLMTVVVLDIFETLYIPDQAKKGAHVQGMAQVLRLRGSDLVYSPRGWSLFRLAHHRIQKQQLAYALAQTAEPPDWFDKLNDDEPYVRLEKHAHSISETCKRARHLQDVIQAGGLPSSSVVGAIKELHSLDQAAVNWRKTSQWYYTSLEISQRPDLITAARDITDTIHLYPDVWIAYEWNYHRAARIIFLQQLLGCATIASAAPDLQDTEEQVLEATAADCLSAIQSLADDYLASVPQTFGDVNSLGKLQTAPAEPPRCRAIGGYLLLWPTRITMAPAFATTPDQKERARRVFERIREYTGMRDLLGDKSIVVPIP